MVCHGRNIWMGCAAATACARVTWAQTHMFHRVDVSEPVADSLEKKESIKFYYL